MTTPDAPTPRMSTARAAVIGALLTALGSISMALYTPAMPTLVGVFDTTMAMVKTTLTAYFAGFAVAQLVCGPLSDAFGRRPITFLFLALYGLGGLAALFAPTVEILVAARLLQGIGAAVGISVSRAVVRDLFSGQESARVLNAIGIVLSIGPAIAPTLGGVVLSIAGWRAIFVVMVVIAVAAVAVVQIFLPETNRAPDRDLARPTRVMSTYAGLAVDPRFLRPALTLGVSVGSIYALGTLLPFVLIGRVGMDPTLFGLGMLAQTGSYFLGGLTARKLMNRIGAERLVLPGLAVAAVGACGTLLLEHVVDPSWATVMAPIAVYAFSIALVIPALTTAVLAPFPKVAGSASSLLGFVQMGSGFLGGLLGALFVDPVIALQVVFPAMQALALATFLFVPRR
ncbi:multidrug effflux MFS transporter [Pinisolibacter aquiterrae]|uniref:multidrug effflux MFS transporter n=1 Tax=Pinisolibacter aquiterrae TaxID=2815579 RepID=UPI001E2D7089|nr:multidrug effflux MFS transporter [Pinisolibacter aquiterrae]MCC8236310.1 multidrug effflux MFS transporter [Pinisolibacter aquiterrae]